MTLKCHTTVQSRTGGVLGAVGARMQKKLTTFLVVTLKTQVFTVTTNAQNTLQHFQGGASALKTFHFFEGAPVFIEGGGRLCYGTMASRNLQRFV